MGLKSGAVGRRLGWGWRVLLDVTVGLYGALWNVWVGHKPGLSLWFFLRENKRKMAGIKECKTKQAMHDSIKCN